VSVAGADRTRGRWLLAGAALWLAAALLIPIAGERVLQQVRGRSVETRPGRAAMSGLFAMLSLGSFSVAALLASAALLRRSGVERETAGAVPSGPAELTARGAQAAHGPRGPLVAALLIVGAAGGLLVETSGRSFEYDEILEMTHEVRTPFLDGLRPRAFINHLSGTLLARAGVALLGDSERAARAGAVAVSILGLAGAAFAARRLSPGPLATISAPLLLGMNGLVLSYSCQIRGYAPLMWAGLGTGALVALAVGSEGPPGRWRTAGLAACALMMALAHFFGFLYLGVLTVGLHLHLWTGSGLFGPPLPATERPRRRAELATTSAVLSMVLGASFCFWAHDLPWLLFRSGAVGTVLRPPRAFSFRRRLLATFPALRMDHGAREWAALLAVALVFGLLVVAWRKIPALRLVILTAVLPVALVLAACLARPVHLFARYFAASAPLGVLALTAGAGWLVARSRRPALLTVLVLLACAAALWPGLEEFRRDDYGYREGIADGIRWLERHGDDRSRLIPGGSDEVRDVVRYYLPREKALELSSVEPLVERQREGTLDLLVTLGGGRLPGWKRIDFEPSTATLPLPATGPRQSPLVLVATQRAAVP